MNVGALIPLLILSQDLIRTVRSPSEFQSIFGRKPPTVSTVKPTATAKKITLPIVIPIILAALRKQDPQLGIKIPEGVEEAIESVTFLKDLNEAVLEALSVGIFEKGETRDFYDKYVKR